MQVNVTTATGEAAGKVLELADTAFACPFNEPLVHQAVTAYLAGARAGTRAQKTRAQVRGGGAKPWRQKGTGRARAGSIRSPLWRGGGKAFAATPSDHRQKLNKKMYRAALRAILSELLRQERLRVVEDFNLDSHKTRDLVARLRALGLEDVAIVTVSPDERLQLAARNLPRVEVLAVSAVNPVTLIRHERVLMTVEVVKQLEARLA